MIMTVFNTKVMKHEDVAHYVHTLVENIICYNMVLHFFAESRLSMYAVAFFVSTVQHGLLAKRTQILHFKRTGAG